MERGGKRCRSRAEVCKDQLEPVRESVAVGIGWKGWIVLAIWLPPAQWYGTYMCLARVCMRALDSETAPSRRRSSYCTVGETRPR
jgi:hypothetical protein